MSTSIRNRKLRLIAGLAMLALALAMIPAASRAFAGVPASLPAQPVAGQPPQAGPAGARVPVQVGAAGPANNSPLAQPASPMVVLYDQYNSIGTNAISSQDFEAANNAFDDQGADDFVVPAGQSWSIDGVDVDGGFFSGSTGPVTTVNVYFYTNSGALPSVLITSQLNRPYTNGPNAGDLVVTLSPSVVLPEGTYWISVQAQMDFTPGGQWGWTSRTVTSNNPSAWRNPGGGFGGCQNWGVRPTVCIPTSSTEPDHVFRLNGTIGGPLGTFTPAPTYTFIPTNTPVPTNTFTVTSSATNTPACASGWSQQAQLPLPLLDNGVTSIGGKVYSFAGVISGGISALSYKYDPSLNTWTSIASLPAGREMPSAVTDGTVAYIFGGADAAGANTNTLYRYDPVGNSYSVLASNPFTTTWAQGGAYLGGNIYWIAGCGPNCGTFSNTVYKYNIAGNSWSQVANYPESDGFLMATSDGTFVYAGGGINTVESAKTYRYDPVGNLWNDAAIADLPVSRWGAASDMYSGKWMLAGGYSVGVIVGSSISWDPVSNTWGPPNDNMIQARARMGGASAAGAFYAIGGREPGGAFAGNRDTQRFVPIPCNSTATSTPTATFTPTITNTPCGIAGGWSPGPNMPTAHVRGVGVWFPASGKLYVMGGRQADPAGNDLLNPRYYDPVANTWTIETGASFPDNQVNNMACAVLTESGTPYIYCVGGSAAGAVTATSRVVRFDPIARIMTTVTTDPWPATPANTLPGGFAVVGNKLYTLGGFTVNINMIRQIWQFDPNAPAGSKWTLKTAQVPDPSGTSTGMGYIPVAAVGTTIYSAGGTQWTGTTVADTQLTFSYDTVADSLCDACVPDLPTAPGSGETRALNVFGKVWLMGGGRTAPNPSANVQQFDPANPGAGWVVQSTFTTPRRNFTTDVDPATGKVYVGGGYSAANLPLNDFQIYSQPALCTPTPTNTPGPTNTPTPSGIINGHLTWQGVLAANRPAVTGTLTLCNAGVPQNFLFTTDTNGNFVVASSLPDGTYNWRVKGGRHLANAGTLTITGGASTQEFGLQRGGDVVQAPASQLNIVNSSDFNAQKLQFGQGGTLSGDVDYNLVVNSSDFGILRNNFGQAGAAVNCP